jgi:hypothetical protein
VSHVTRPNEGISSCPWQDVPIVTAVSVHDIAEHNVVEPPGDFSGRHPRPTLEIMSTAPSPVPRTVRAAGVLVALQGVAGGVVCLALAVRAFVGATDLVTTLGTALWFAVIAAAVIGVGAALWRGRHGARSPAVVAQLVLLGVAWYAAGPSSRPEYGGPGAVYCIVVLVLLFSASTTRWAYSVEAGRQA